MESISFFIIASVPVITMIMGFYFGFRIGKDKEIPELKTPVQIVEEHKEKVDKQRQERQTRNELATYMENLDNYPYNQKDIKE